MIPHAHRVPVRAHAPARLSRLAGRGAARPEYYSLADLKIYLRTETNIIVSCVYNSTRDTCDVHCDVLELSLEIQLCIYTHRACVRVQDPGKNIKFLFLQSVEPDHLKDEGRE